MRTTLFILLLGVCGVVLPACSAPARSTRLTGADLSDMAGELAQKLRDSDFMKLRTADSPAAVITWDRVENLTMDIITPGEQWSMMQRVRDSAGLVQLGKDKAFTLVIPAALKAEGEQRGGFERGFGAGRAPTHRMDATMRSATRSATSHRTDTYLCDFRVTELATGALLWSDTVALKRAAAGLSFD
ncbi:MAG: hypothetical protein U0637_01990 [Phycisphaerales bacterium]